MISAISAIIGTVASAAVQFFKSRNEDRMDARELERVQVEIEYAVKAALEENRAQIEQASASIVKAEVEGEGIKAKWRPHMMYWLMGMVSIIPVFALIEVFTGLFLVDVFIGGLSQVPGPFWTLLTIGMGGYIGGRTVEKTAKTVVEGMNMGAFRRG
jgi:hypothetical protein